MGMIFMAVPTLGGLLLTAATYSGDKTEAPTLK